MERNSSNASDALGIEPRIIPLGVFVLYKKKITVNVPFYSLNIYYLFRWQIAHDTYFCALELYIYVYEYSIDVISILLRNYLHLKDLFCKLKFI